MNNVGQTSLVLAVDIGNSAIHCGLLTSRGAGTYFSFETKRYQRLLLKSALVRRTCHIKKVILCSVVPAIEKQIRHDIRSFLSCPIVSVGKEIIVPIRHRYNTHMLGADRAVAVFGALRTYQSRKPLLVIDFGTAITFDFINGQGVFEGGLIVPGILTSYNALGAATALLPKRARLGRPTSLLARHTRAAMEAGTIYGFARLTDGIIHMFRERYGRITTIATGGSARFLKPFCHYIDIYDEHLILHALSTLARKNGGVNHPDKKHT